MEAKLFVTDYASYNEGTQFEFGHWVELSDFSDADEFTDYLSNHFKQCDEKRPLGYGAIREEWMFTDFEDFPKQLYSESMNVKDMERLFEFLELNDDEKARACYLLEQGEDADYAIANHEDVFMYEYDGSSRAKWHLFEMLYPEAEAMEQSNEYVSIDYDRFIRENYNEFEYEGLTYLVESFN